METPLAPRPHPRGQQARLRTRRLMAGLLAFFLLFFGGLYWQVRRADAADEPFRQVAAAGTVADLRARWDAFTPDTRDEPGLRDSTRTHLAALQPTPADIVAADAWLGPRLRPLNVVVVPDLSYRLRLNNPATDDIVLLTHIWQEFVRLTRLRHTPDRLLVELTDGGQAQGQFKAFTDSLIFDLSQHPKEQVNRVYFEASRNKGRFQQCVHQLYQFAQTQPTSGADYWQYVNNTLPTRLQPATALFSPRNVVIFLTDGYLETSATAAGRSTSYTPLYGNGLTVGKCDFAHIQKNRDGGMTLAAAIQNALPKHSGIKPCDHTVRLDHTIVLLAQIDERAGDPTHTRDKPILDYYWRNWLTGMGATHASHRREPGNAATRAWLTQYLAGQ